MKIAINADWCFLSPFFECPRQIWSQHAGRWRNIFQNLESSKHWILSMINQRNAMYWFAMEQLCVVLDILEECLKISWLAMCCSLGEIQNSEGKRSLRSSCIGFKCWHRCNPMQMWSRRMLVCRQALYASPNWGAEWHNASTSNKSLNSQRLHKINCYLVHFEAILFPLYVSWMLGDCLFVVSDRLIANPSTIGSHRGFLCGCFSGVFEEHTTSTCNCNSTILFA